MSETALLGCRFDIPTSWLFSKIIKFPFLSPISNIFSTQAIDVIIMFLVTSNFATSEQTGMSSEIETLKMQSLDCLMLKANNVKQSSMVRKKTTLIILNKPDLVDFIFHSSLAR